MSQWRWVRFGGLVLIVVAGLLAAGCETEDRREALEYANVVAVDGADADADLFHTDVTLYRRYTGSKWRLDKDHIFTVKDESHIKAAVAFVNVRPDRIYSVHLAWIRPDGKEMFRRYAEVTRHSVSLPVEMVPDTNGALPAIFSDDLVERFGDKVATKVVERLTADPELVVPVTEVVYKKAVDLGYASRKVLLTSDPVFSLESRLNISREKERELGDYLLRIYLDRRLLQEVPFTLQENN